MKKIKLLGILAVLVVLFAFTACDQILEAFYPEFGDQGSRSGTYRIGIWAEILIPAGEQIPAGNPMIGAKAVSAWSSDQTPVADSYMSPNWTYNEFGDTVFSAYIELYINDDGDYRVTVWGETDGNQQPNYDEPQTDAVWWHDDPSLADGGFWDNIFSFYTGDTEFGPSREGEAKIWTGGNGAAPNYQFNVMGPLVMDEFQVGQNRVFNVNVEDPGKNISDFSWDLYDDLYNWLGGEWVPLNQPANSSAFTINDALIPRATPASYTKGWYWIEVNLTYEDGTYRYKRFPMRVISEAPVQSYSVEFDIWDVDLDPMYLIPGTTYQVQFRILASDQTEIGTGFTAATVDNGANYGLLMVDTASAGLGLTYNQTDYTDGGTPPGINWIEITIDSTGDSAFGPGDFKRIYPISLDATDLGTMVLSIGGWELRPIF